MFLWRRRAIRAALERYTGLLQSLGPMVGAPAMLEHAYEAIQRPVSIDYAVMEGAAQSGQRRDGARWTSAGRTSARGRRCSRRSAPAGRAPSSSPARPVEVEHDDLVVRRIGGRLGVIAPPERGRMTATQPIAVLRGAGPDRALVERLLERCSNRED